MRWACNVRHEAHTLHAIFCDETDIDSGEVTHFAWITDYRPKHNNAAKLVNQGGRQRWRIENEGFNTQKNGGYELEHGYGTRGFAWKNYYYLVQIAHLFMQLMLHGDLFAKLQRQLDPTATTTTVIGFYESIKAFVRRLGEMFRCGAFSNYARDGTFARNIQIRLDSS